MALGGEAKHAFGVFYQKPTTYRSVIAGVKTFNAVILCPYEIVGVSTCNLT